MAGSDVGTGKALELQAAKSVNFFAHSLVWKGGPAMQEPISHATIINLEHLPISPSRGSRGRMKEHIVQYLETLAQEKLSCHADYLDLPSIGALSNFFKTTSIDVYDALRALRVYGYDYQFSSLDGSVQIWRQDPRVRKK